MSASDRLAPIIDIAWGRMPASEIKELRDILEEVARLEESHAELCEILEDWLELPYDIDQATVPKGGIDVAPQQVVGVLFVCVARRRKAKAAIAKAKGGEQ